MAITAELVTALGGDEIDYVPLTPNTRDFTVELPAGTWLVQVEASTSSTTSRTVTLGGVSTRVPPEGSCLVTRIVQGGTLEGKGDGSFTSVVYTHGIAIRLGD